MYAHRTITLRGSEPYGRRVPPDRLGPLFSQIGPALQRCVRMRFLGRSRAPGRQPAWLVAAGDIRFVDYSGDRDTTLHFEVPRFGEAAPALYEQGELWPRRPDPKATSFDLLAEVLSEIGVQNRDSEAFDRPLLKEITKFEPVFDQHIQEIALGDTDFEPLGNGIVNRRIVQAADELQAVTPSPRRVRVFGKLDRLWESRQSFALLLEGDPSTLQGVFVERDVTSLKEFFGQRVLVEGRAVYRPSGCVLRIEAEQVCLAGDMQGPWKSVPPAIDKRATPSKWRVRQTAESGVNAVIGKWPGEESDAETLALLDKLR